IMISFRPLMNNEKIAIIALVIIIAGALSLFLISSFGGDILSNLFNDTNTTPIGDTIIEEGDCADVHYIGRFFSNNTIFDTSYEDVAIDAGIYNESRPYDPLKIFVDPKGTLQPPENFSEYSSGMIQGFLEGLIDMGAGETKTIVIPPEKGYGIWNQSLAELYGISPYPVESPVEIEWDMERNAFMQYFSDVDLTVNTTFDWGLVMLGLNNTINATITKINETNVIYDVKPENGTTFTMPLFEWPVTIILENETTFILKNSVKEDYLTTMDLGFGQYLHLKVLDVNETEIILAINIDAPEQKFIGETLEFEIEVIELYKTS
ncbi:MAG: FKBP-type peptidyl-prolyl cis-trans isomerase, partial [Candidatus Thermoplasmatota archaeon]|nr:FKBP-type peptidyl-prolyl cis-trans isomerase [Candidatus Thermoplasmatota archaeon]